MAATTYRIMCATSAWTQTADTTSYIALMGELDSTTNRIQAETRFRQAYTLGNLFTYILNNGISTASTLKLIINGGTPGNPQVSITANTTGIFEDTANTATISVNALACWVLTVAKTSHTDSGIFNICQIGCTLAHASDNISIIQGADPYTPSLWEANITSYVSLSGIPGDTLTETNTKYTFRTSATLAKLRCYIVTNTVTATSTLKSRINGLDGGQAVSITASTAGQFEDATGTDSVTAGQDVNFQYIGGATGTSMTVSVVQVQSTSTARQSISGLYTGAAYDNNTFFMSIEGLLIVSGTGDTQSQTTVRVAQTARRMFVRVITNTGTASSVTLRKNGVDTALVASITASTTGVFEDTANSVDFVATDEINYKLIGPTSGSVTITYIGIEYPGPGAAGNYWTATLAETLSPADAPPVKIPTKRLLDSEAINDLVVKVATKLLLDSPALNDRLIKRMTKVLSDSLPTAEALVAMAWPHPILADSVMPNDALVRATRTIRAETIAAVEALLVKSVTKSLGDAVAVSDALVNKPSRTMTDAVALVDALRTAWVYVRTMSDSEAIADSLVKTMSKVLADSPAIADALRKTVTKPLADPVALTDALIKGITKTIGDPLAMQDALRLTWFYLRALAESEAILDAISTVMTKSVILSDPVALAEAIRKATQKILPEQGAVVDALVKVYSRLLSDGLALTDSILAQIVAAMTTVTLADPVSLADAFGKGASKVVPDQVALVDGLVKNVLHILSDAMVLNDAVLAQLVAQGVKILAESLNLQDGLVKVMCHLLGESVNVLDDLAKTYQKVLPQSLSLADAVSILMRRLAFMADSIVLSDAIIRKPQKTLGESLAFDETIRRTYAKVLSETPALSDALVRVYKKLLSEGFTTTEALRLMATKVRADTITINDRALFVFRKVLVDGLPFSDAVTIIGGTPVGQLWIQTLAETIGMQEALALVIGWVRIAAESLSLTDSLALRLVGPFMGRPMEMQGKRLLPQRGFSPINRLPPS